MATEPKKIFDGLLNTLRKGENKRIEHSDIIQALIAIISAAIARQGADKVAQITGIPAEKLASGDYLNELEQQVEIHWQLYRRTQLPPNQLQ